MSENIRTFKSLGRLFLVGTILNFASGNFFPSKSESTYKDNTIKNPLLERIDANNKLDLGFLAYDTISPATEYQRYISGKFKGIVDEVYNNNKIDNSIVDKNLILSLMQNESSFVKDTISPKGAIGLMQPMRDTWYDYSKKNFKKYSKIPEYNIDVGTKHLLFLEKVLTNKFPNWDSTSPNENIIIISAAYNGGQGLFEDIKWKLDEMPLESRRHGEKVLRSYIQYKKNDMRNEYFSILENYLQKNDSSWNDLSWKEKQKSLDYVLKMHLTALKIKNQLD